MSSRHAPRRSASLQPSATVILAAVGELQRVVACTKYCADVVPEVSTSSRTIIADSWTANNKEIVAANPDLFIAPVPYRERAVTEILTSGTRFLNLAPKALPALYTPLPPPPGNVGSLEPRGQPTAPLRP